MKKINVFVLLGVALLTMNACKSEQDIDKELKFSKLTVEKQKEKIETNGIEFINSMDGIQDTKAMTAMFYMLELSGSEVFEAPMKKLSADIKNGRKTSFSNFDQQMRASYVDSDVWGDYSYNFDTWEMEKKVSLTNKIIIRFPAAESSTKNNAVITITYAESTVKMIDSDDFYPSSITFKLLVDSKEQMSADFIGKYYSDGSPEKASQSLKIDDFNWKAEIDNNKKTALGSIEFKKGSKILFKSTGEISGTLTQKELEDAIELEKPQNAIKSFAVYFQLMDIAVKGGTNEFKAFADEVTKIEDNKSLSEKQAMEEIAKLVNKYMVCTAFFADDNKKFADVEFYAVQEMDEYSYSDYEKQKYVTETEYYYVLNPRFVLSDGSKVDAEEYARTGFEDLINRIGEMLGQE